MSCLCAHPDSEGAPKKNERLESPFPGWWGLFVKEGVFGETQLDGMSAFTVFGLSAKKHLSSHHCGFYLDHRSSPGQRDALEAIVTRKVEGDFSGWNGKVNDSSQPRYVPIEFLRTNNTHTLHIYGVMDAVLEANNVHGPARQCLDFSNDAFCGTVSVPTEGTTHFKNRNFHLSAFPTRGFYSNVMWNGVLNQPQSQGAERIGIQRDAQKSDPLADNHRGQNTSQ